MHKRCSGIIDILKKGSKFECKKCANQQRDIADNFPGIELNEQLLEIVERVCYLGDTIKVSVGALDSVKTRIRHLVSFLASNGLPLGIKGRLYSACVWSIMLYESVTWSVKEEDVID